jgi:branched-subunit amino acid ABC-type transport system permease component
MTFLGGMAIGLAQSVLTPYARVTAYRSSAPFVLAIIALLIMSRRRVVAVSRAAN